MEFLRIFSQLNKTNASIAGGKGASLGEMFNAGIPVPSGFVILSAAFEKFLAETDLNVEIDSILETVKHNDINTVEQASEKIQALILAAKMPDDIAGLIQEYFKELETEYVAVRSSATAEDSVSAAWAGQLDSFLNTTEKDLLEKVKRCWASLFTPRAIFYRFEQNLHTQKISVAVVVQKMVESEVSGIAFSVHPVTQDYNQLIIEAGFGLGEAIVSGQVTPDSYVIEKEPRRIIDKNVAEQTRGIFRATGGGDEWRDIPSAQGNEQKINDEQILELSEIILRIENHYGFPCDIEWAYENGKFYIVQSRPITTLVKKENSETQDCSNYGFVQKASQIKWLHWLERPYGSFIGSLNFAGVSSYYFEQVGLNGLGFDTSLYQYPDFYYSEELFQKNVAVITEYFKNHSVSDFSNILSVMHEKNKKALLALIEEKISVVEKLKKMREILRPYFAFLWLNIPLEAYFQKRLNDEVPQFVSGDIKKFIGDASISKKKNQYGKMLVALRSDKELSEIQQRFGWLKSRDGFSDFYSIEELKEIRENLTDEHQSDIEIPEPLCGLFLEIKELSFFRTDRTDKYYEALGLVRPIFQEIADYVGVSFKELENYDVDSIIEENPKLVLKPFNYFCLDGRQIIQSDHIVAFATDNQEGQIKGQPAFGGIVRGKVKVVRHPSEVNKVEVGDILVSQMTLPSFISAMQKAVAFVTDEGGITCHASIIARELKKPCIIGTKIATKVLHDGDLIEVDADNGVVKVLKHNQIS